jgi:bifunctional non-homologous end joining protein LigD
VNLSNPDKIYWPKEKYTKLDLLQYYQGVSKYLLPFLKDRPMVLKRFPSGIEGESFIQKNTDSLHLPEGFETAAIQRGGKLTHYLLVQDEAALEYVVNLGTIEFHPFHTRVGHLEYPDYFILDLDPEDVPFQIVMETAKTIHHLFEDWQIPHYCKTSGGRGLHIYIPLEAKYTQGQVAKFGEALAMLIHEQLPKITSLERRPAKRQKKIYLDVLQNRSGQTIAAPYTVRGRPGAPVSTPLHWEELKRGVKPEDFNMKTLPSRLQEVGEIFSPVLGKGFQMKQWIDKQLPVR